MKKHGHNVNVVFICVPTNVTANFCGEPVDRQFIKTHKNNGKKLMRNHGRKKRL